MPTRHRTDATRSTQAPAHHAASNAKSPENEQASAKYPPAPPVQQSMLSLFTAQEAVACTVPDISGGGTTLMHEVERKAPARAHLALEPRAVTRVPQRIAVEGPLRVGKSTLARLLAERLNANYLAEPEANPFLSRFYAGEPGMAFSTQMWFLRERLAQLQAASALTGPIVADYILEKDKLFAFLNLSDSELAIYKGFYAAHAPAALAQGPELVVYLQASPAVLLERRRRKGLAEEQGIDAAYTEQLCAAYEHFFSRYTASRLLVVDTSQIDFVDNEHDRELLLDRILAPVHGREHFAPLRHIA